MTWNTVKRKEWTEKNREKVLASGRKDWEKHREERVGYKRKKYAENPEYHLAQCKKWRDANKEKKALSDAEYYKNNKIASFARSWAFDNRKKIFVVLGDSCFSCGSSENVRIHHKNYIGKDGNYTKDFSDLEIMCCKCHGLEHRFDSKREMSCRGM